MNLIIANSCHLWTACHFKELKVCISFSHHGSSVNYSVYSESESQDHTKMTKILQMCI